MPIYFQFYPVLIINTLYREIEKQVEVSGTFRARTQSKLEPSKITKPEIVPSHYESNCCLIIYLLKTRLIIQGLSSQVKKCTIPKETKKRAALRLEKIKP